MWKINCFSINESLMGTEILFTGKFQQSLFSSCFGRKTNIEIIFLLNGDLIFFFSPRFCFLAHNFSIHLQPVNTVKNVL